jgi:hypothetical protein
VRSAWGREHAIPGAPNGQERPFGLLGQISRKQSVARIMTSTLTD